MAEAPEYPFSQTQPLPELPTAGYDDDYFLDPPPESLHCPVCLLVLREPHLISCCGAHICQVCIERIQENEQSCPCCRSENYINILNKKERGKVWELKVRCLNSVKGCEWVGELGDQERHFTNKCQYVEGVCRYGCGESYPRFLLHIHEQDECPEQPVEMKTETIMKQVMENVSALKVKYERKIANLREERHKMEKQEIQKQQADGISQFMNDLTDQERRIQGQQGDEILQLRKDISHLVTHVKGQPIWYILTPFSEFPYLLPPCTLTMYNFTEHKRLGDAWRSQPFYSGPNGYKLLLEVDADGSGTGKGTHISVYVYLMKGENDDMLTWPLNCDITFRLLNWREDKGHEEGTVDHYNAPIECRTRITQADTAPGGQGYEQFLSHSDLYYNITNNTEYINNDTLCFVISEVIVHSQ